MRPAILALLAAASAACATAPRHPVVARPWLAARSAHFVMFTDVDAATAETAVHGLEQKYDALGRVYAMLVGGRELPARVTEVVLFARCAEMPVPVAGMRGMVVITPDFRDEKRIVTCGRNEYAEETMLHELAHVLNLTLVGVMPLWLNEGLATYAQTLAVEDDHIVLGRTQVTSVYLRAHRSPLGLADLLAARPEIFYGDSRGLYYQAAQSLVHFFVHTSPQLQARFKEYLGRLAAGEERGLAWSLAIEGMPPAALDEELRSYHLGRASSLLRLPYAAPPRPAIDVAPLRPGEAAALYVSLTFDTRAVDPAARLAILEEAARRDPEWPDLRLWSAIVELASPRGDRAAAVRLLREHAERAPDDERARAGILATETPPAYSIELLPDPASLRAYEADVAELVRTARGASALNTAAWYYAQRRDPAAGLPLVKRALAQDPSNPLYMDTYALLVFQSGDRSEAVRWQERAVQGFGERVPRAMVERLEGYRKAASTAR